jgi:hypothetical protein
MIAVNSGSAAAFVPTRRGVAMALDTAGTERTVFFIPA